MRIRSDYVSLSPIVVAAVLTAAIILFSVLYSRTPQINFVESSTTSTRYLADGTEGLTKQTALHLSKMQGGASIGGFPGFEPPDDDERYKRKVKGEGYNAQDVNNWVKEINNFLKQIVKKNPNRSLEKILQKQGLTPSQTDDFLDAIQRTQYVADGMKGHGVNPETVKMLESLMKTLGIPLWTY